MILIDWFADRASLVRRLANAESQLEAAGVAILGMSLRLRKELEREQEAHRETRRKLDKERTGTAAIRQPLTGLDELRRLVEAERATRTPEQDAPRRMPFNAVRDAIAEDADMTRREDI